MTKYSARRTIHHTKHPTINSRLTSSSITSSSANSQNGAKLPYTSPLTTSSYLSSYQHSKHSSSAAAASQPTSTIPTPNPSSIPSGASKYQIQPPRRTLKDCVPVKLGKGVYIDTMISDTKVDINRKDLVPMDGNTSLVYHITRTMFTCKFAICNLQFAMYIFIFLCEIAVTFR